MELDNIKLQTTWNDAAGSLNNNFAKLRQAIALGSLGNAVMLDTELSDDSENAVQNKAIKRYIDEEIDKIEEQMAQMQQRITDMEQATIQPL